MAKKNKEKLEYIVSVRVPQKVGHYLDNIPNKTEFVREAVIKEVDRKQSVSEDEIKEDLMRERDSILKKILAESILRED
jgi:hypothetical protein